MASQPLHSTLAPAPLATSRPKPENGTWVNSEYGVLKEVLLACPRHLSLVPCNEVSKKALRSGAASCTVRAAAQHADLVETLTAAAVAVQMVSAVPGVPDLVFARDSSLMTPWGLIGLKPGAPHRRAEVDVVLGAARVLGLPIRGRVSAGRVEGGDVCLLRPGHVAIGISEERTDVAGASALGDIFVRGGWSVTFTAVDPQLLHLDTHFCMLDEGLALGCLEKLDVSFVKTITRLGIKIVPVHVDETMNLGCNVLALGRRRILSTGSAPRVDEIVRRHGFEVLTVALDEFTQCGGGVHCLTMPIKRH